MVEYENELNSRPVTRHFHGLKGHKFDVEVPYAQRHKHVADRLGHPEIFPTPIETLLRLEQDRCHPLHLDQPFVQVPSAEPAKDLNLIPGEVIYENPNIKEWNSFFVSFFTGATAFFGAWLPFCTIVKSSTPAPKIREEFVVPYYDQNYFAFDHYQVAPVLVLAFLALFQFNGLVS